MPVHDRPQLRTLDDQVRVIPGQTPMTTFWVRNLEPGVPWPAEWEPDAAIPSVPAVVNFGQWIVRCPECPSAQSASWDDPRFYCASRDCPRIYERRPYAVRFPDDWELIERMLLERPDDSVRNWEPNEPVLTVALLNVQHMPELLAKPEKRTAALVGESGPETLLPGVEGRVVTIRGQSGDSERSEAAD